MPYTTNRTPHRSHPHHKGADCTRRVAVVGDELVSVSTHKHTPYHTFGDRGVLGRFPDQEAP